MLILFLDDDATRTKMFRRAYPSAHTAETAEAMIQLLGALTEDTPASMVFLDHDLGGETYVDSAGKNTGMEVVRWIESNKPCIDNIIVHTCNSYAGVVMVDKLEKAGYPTQRVPFPNLLAHLKEKEEALAAICDELRRLDGEPTKSEQSPDPSA